ncbi:MAG: DsbE family thiol:disulfide interchange protein [Hyphomonadaceae bacterium]|nr:DsbE family thiol:disulfide interchange protein [Hyphomonadaceae bacterium]
MTAERPTASKRMAAFAPILIFAALLAIVALTLASGGARKESSEGLVGRVLPAYALAPLSGEAPVTQATFAGRRHVVNFFASWCVPCRYEHPLLMDLKARGVPVLGVAYKDAPEKTSAFLARDGDPYAAIGQDPAGRFGLELGIEGVPETFVIDADGTIIALHRGPITEEVMRDRILPALGLP